MFESESITFRNNHVHDNVASGFWSDGSRGLVVEDNLFEDNGLVSIVLELSANSIVRRNVVKRSGWQAISLSTAHDSQIYENVSEDSGRGIGIAVNCQAMAEGAAAGKGWDLANNTVHDNTIKVGTSSVPLAGGLPFANGLWITSCTDAEAAPYLNGSKNNADANDVCYLPDVGGAYWHWGASGLFPWSSWQSAGQDVMGTIHPASEY
jgi:hypothetical protein